MARAAGAGPTRSSRRPRTPFGCRTAAPGSLPVAVLEIAAEIDPHEPRSASRERLLDARAEGGAEPRERATRSRPPSPRACPSSCAALPRRAVLALGRRLGRLWARLDARHLAIARDNLRRAFPDWDEARVDRDGARRLRALRHRDPRPALDGGPARGGAPRPRRRRGRRAPAARARGRPRCRRADRLTSATGRSRRSPRCRSSATWPSIARPLDNPALDRRLVALRTSTGNTVIYKQKALAHVHEDDPRGRHRGRPDRPERAGEGRRSSCASSAARRATTTVAAALALKTGCAIVPVRCALQPNGRYRMSLRPAGRVDGVRPARRGHRRADPAPDDDRSRAGCASAPEQWLWLHRRWKTQPPAAAPRPPPNAGRSARRAPAESARDRRRAPPRARAELGRRRRALAAGAARRAPALPDRAPHRPRAAVGRRALPRGARGRRDPGEPRPLGRRASRCAGAFDLGDPPAELVRDGSRRRGGRASRSAGATRRTAARCCSRAAAACPRGSGAAARCTTIARCSKAWGSRSRARPTPRSPVPRSGAPRRARSSAATGRWIGVNPGAFYGTAKRWPPERFAAAAELVARRLGATVAIVGGAAERPLGEAIASMLQVPVARPLRRDDARRPRRRAEAPAPAAHQRLRARCTSPPPSARRSSRSSARPTGRRRRPWASGPCSCARTSTARPACCASARSTTAA